MEELGALEAIIGILVILFIAASQFVAVKVGMNGIREDVSEIKTDVKALGTSDVQQTTDIAVHDQRIVSLESRIKKVEL